MVIGRSAFREEDREKEKAIVTHCELLSLSACLSALRQLERTSKGLCRPHFQTSSWEM